MILKGFIFDLDGTLINSIPVVRASLKNTLFKFSGREYSESELSSLFGPSEDGIFKELYPECWNESLQFYLKEYNRLHIEYAEPFPGIHEVLTFLQENKIKLAIVSGKGPGSMEISLKHSGLKEYFDVIITGSESGASKPENIRQVLKIWNYSPHEVAYVGDIAYDVKAAKDVGVLSISALWAETVQVQKVLEMKPHIAFIDVISLIRWLNKMFRPGMKK